MNEEDADRKLYPVLAMLCVCVCVCVCVRARTCAQEGQGLPASDSGAQGAARSLQLPGVRHSEKAGGWQMGTSGRVTKSQPGRVSSTSSLEDPPRVLSNSPSDENQRAPAFQIKTPG